MKEKPFNLTAATNQILRDMGAGAKPVDGATFRAARQGDKAAQAEMDRAFGLKREKADR